MGSTKISQPSPPPAPTIGNSISEYVKAVPKLFALQQSQAPQEAALQLRLLQEYGGPLGEAMQAAQRALQPETSQIQEELAAQAREGIKADVPEAEREQFLSDYRANLGTNIGSPIAAASTSRALALQRLERQNMFRNMGLSLAGRQPLAQPFAPTVTNFTKGFTPGQALGFNQGVYGTKAGIFGTQAGMYNNQPGSILGQMGGAIMGSAIGGYGAGLGGSFWK